MKQEHQHTQLAFVRRGIGRLMLTGALALAGAQTAFAHITYTNRDFGSFAGDGTDAPVTISINNVSSAFGWADATDDDFGDSHRTRAFRFNLQNPAIVTVNIQGAAVGGSPPLQYPAFSIYKGLAHVPPAAADHDGSPITVAYLSGLGGTQPKEGALVALGDWKIGNEDIYNTPGDPSSGVAVPASLSSFEYFGHAADGTPANYGVAPGINGDGLADGNVTGTITLPAGDFTIIVGGGDYAASIGAAGPYTNYGVSVTLSVAPRPEPIMKGGSFGAIPGAVYKTIYPPAVNVNETVTYRASVKQGSSSSFVIARRTILSELVARSGTPAPDAGADWKKFGDPVINDNGEVAFTGGLTDVPSTMDTGVWSDLGGTMRLALREGDQAPGLAAGQLFTKTYWINLQNGVLYINAATSDGSTKINGIWKWDGVTLRKVIAVGDTITLSDFKTHVVRSFSKPSFAGNGNATSGLVGRNPTMVIAVACTSGAGEVVTLD